MAVLTRVAGALAVAALAAGCSNANVMAPVHSREQALAAPARTDYASLRVVAGLKITINDGIASFTAVSNRPVFIAPSNQTVEIPAMNIDLCPAFQRRWSTPCASPTPSPTPMPMLRLAAGSAIPKGTYYLAVQLPGGKRVALSGPGVLTDQTVALPASNGSLAILANTRYKFFLAVSAGTAVTPTPSPTPTPLANLCPSYAGSIAPVAPPVSTPAPVLVSPPPVNFMSNYQFSASPAPIYQFTCGPAQVVYFAKPGGTISAYDPADSSIRNVAQVNAVPSTITLMISAVDKLNNLYATAADASQSIIYQVHYDGTSQSSVAMPASFLSGVPMTEGSDGNVYGVGSTGTSSLIFRVHAGLTVDAINLPAGCVRPFRITAGSDGNLWILDSGCGLVKIGTASAPAIVSPRLGFDASGFEATAFAQGPDEAFYAAVPGAVQRADAATGAVTSIALPPEASSVQGLVAGPDHRLWLSASGGSVSGVMARLDLGTGEIVEWPSTEGYGNDSSGAPTNPAFLVIGPDGNLYGADRGVEHSVMKLQPSLAGR